MRVDEGPPARCHAALCVGEFAVARDVVVDQNDICGLGVADELAAARGDRRSDRHRLALVVEDHHLHAEWSPGRNGRGTPEPWPRNRQRPAAIEPILAAIRCASPVDQRRSYVAQGEAPCGIREQPGDEHPESRVEAGVALGAGVHDSSGGGERLDSGPLVRGDLDCDRRGAGCDELDERRPPGRDRQVRARQEVEVVRRVGADVDRVRRQRGGGLHVGAVARERA